jgi:hypothetical protein
MLHENEAIGLEEAGACKGGKQDRRNIPCSSSGKASWSFRKLPLAPLFGIVLASLLFFGLLVILAF